VEIEKSTRTYGPGSVKLNDALLESDNKVVLQWNLLQQWLHGHMAVLGILLIPDETSILDLVP